RLLSPMILPRNERSLTTGSIPEVASIRAGMSGNRTLSEYRLLRLICPPPTVGQISLSSATKNSELNIATYALKTTSGWNIWGAFHRASQPYPCTTIRSPCRSYANEPDCPKYEETIFLLGIRSHLRSRASSHQCSRLLGRFSRTDLYLARCEANSGSSLNKASSLSRIGRP